MVFDDFDLETQCEEYYDEDYFNEELERLEEEINEERFLNSLKED